MPRRLYIANLALALLLALLLGWLMKVKVIDQIELQTKQIQVLAASMESLLKIVGEFKTANNRAP